MFLWPGFIGVARYGLWGQLAIALAFGFLCQGVLTLNFLWCDFLSSFLRKALYSILFVSWVLFNIAANSRLKKYEKMRKNDFSGEALLEAQTHYLRGNWFETECCLKSILKKNQYDAEALLMLATLYRHVKRYEEAKKMLCLLEKLDSSSHWQYEILIEKKAIKNDEKECLEKTIDDEMKGGSSDNASVGICERTGETLRAKEFSPSDKQVADGKHCIRHDETCNESQFQDARDRDIMSLHIEERQTSDNYMNRKCA